ncbi:MAG TPA: YggT family protein [Acidimicrobiales bacterium]|nr:YggT family protein [Acidimicrobiales bacterium]
MTAANDPMVQNYERRAEEYEHSPQRALLRAARVVVWLVYAFALVTGVLLTTAFFLQLAGANPDASFVEWVYRSTDRAMRPFRGIFPTQELDGSSVLDFSYLVAAIVYFVIALLVDGLHRWLTGRLRRQDWEAGRARAQADMAAQRVVDQQHADERAAQQAAAREYAARQASAQQYAVARVATEDALARQRPPVNPERPEPPSPGW